MRWRSSYHANFRWHTWYAWHPILVDGTWVWLERIFRKMESVQYDCFYKYSLTLPMPLEEMLNVMLGPYDGLSPETISQLELLEYAVNELIDERNRDKGLWPSLKDYESTSIPRDAQDKVTDIPRPMQE